MYLWRSGAGFTSVVHWCCFQCREAESRRATKEVSEVKPFEVDLIRHSAGSSESDVEPYAHFVTGKGSRVVLLCPISLGSKGGCYTTSTEYEKKMSQIVKPEVQESVLKNIITAKKQSQWSLGMCIGTARCWNDLSGLCSIRVISAL